MTVSLTVALLALLVALSSLLALGAVYVRVQALEVGRAAKLSGREQLVGRPAPRVVAPRVGQRMGVVAVLDSDCALCHVVRDALADVVDPGVRTVALDTLPGLDHGRVELLHDLDARAALYEGYAPTLLALDAAGTVTRRHFVYPDTDLRALVADLTGKVIA